MRMAVRVIGDFSPGYMYLGSLAVCTVFLGLEIGFLVTRAPVAEESLEVMGLAVAFLEEPGEEPGEEEEVLDVFCDFRGGDGLPSGVHGGVGREVSEEALVCGFLEGVCGREVGG